MFKINWEKVIRAMAFPYRKIMCPIDFEDNSMRALDKAIEIALHFGAAVILVHALPLVVQFGELPIPVELYEEQEKAARIKLGEVARQKLDGVEHELAVYTGRRSRQCLAGGGKIRTRLTCDGHSRSKRTAALVSRQCGRGGGAQSKLPGFDDSKRSAERTCYENIIIYAKRSPCGAGNSVLQWLINGTRSPRPETNESSVRISLGSLTRSERSRKRFSSPRP
jgi:hypothetical protein